jgi:hypothetical protein
MLEMPQTRSLEESRTWNQICEKAHPNQHRQLRDKKHIISKLVHKSNIIQGEMVIYLDDASTKHFTFLIVPKSYILLV